MLRVRVELIPYGRDAGLDPLYEILVENDESGVPGGPHTGGVGNYNVFPHGETLEHLHVVDYPSMYACGRVEGVERTDDHRLLVAEHALGVAREAEAAFRDRGDPHGRNLPPVVRDLAKKAPYPDYPA